MTRTRFKFAALLILLLTALPFWAQAGVEGQIVKVKGKVSLVRGQAAPVLLRKDDTVKAGDEILTDRKSSATILMPDRSTVRIYPNSRVVLQAQTSPWKEFLHVWLGNVRVQIEKLSGRPNPKSVTTPTAIIAVRGTIFTVAVNQDGDTQVGVERGLVSVANQLHPQDEVMVNPGQFVWVRRGQRPTQPQMMRSPMSGMMNSDGMGMPGMGSGMGTSGMGSMGTRPAGGMGGAGGMRPPKQ